MDEDTLSKCKNLENVMEKLKEIGLIDYTSNYTDTSCRFDFTKVKSGDEDYVEVTPDKINAELTHHFKYQPRHTWTNLVFLHMCDATANIKTGLNPNVSVNMSCKRMVMDDVIDGIVNTVAMSNGKTPASVKMETKIGW